MSQSEERRLEICQKLSLVLKDLRSSMRCEENKILVWLSGMNNSLLCSEMKGNPHRGRETQLLQDVTIIKDSIKIG